MKHHRSRTRSRTMVAACAGAIAGAIAVPALPALGQFSAENIQLLSHLDLDDFDLKPSNGNDCWGYVSPSGREYALVGLSNHLAVVEVSDPQSPVIVAQVPHVECLWADVKVYQDHCYVVNECGGGMDVVDLSNVDTGAVTAQAFTEGGMAESHNVAIDTDSGYLYLVGSNLNGGRLVAYDLSDPGAPVLAGQMSEAEGSGGHDAQVVTYASGPNAGRQIAFGCDGGAGLNIYDVTDKSSMFRVTNVAYPNVDYCHQGWLDPTGTVLYVNDELDGLARTIVIDVTDVDSANVLGEFQHATGAIDHNLYVAGDLVYEANYTSGLRVFDVSDGPLEATEVAYFDTYPEGDGASYDGAWSVYPYFPSGTLIVSDIDRGMFAVRLEVAADVNGDGVVDVEDLVAVVTGWGDCPPGPYPADIDGSGGVDVADLIEVILNWG